MSKKILVVDDNLYITDLVKTILEAAGYDCTTLNSGDQCIQLLKSAGSNAFDLLLMDIAMPRVTGIDVLNRIKSDAELKSIKVVFFTASSISEVERDDLKKIGALDCMKKPFTKKELLDTIAKYLK